MQKKVIAMCYVYLNKESDNTISILLLLFDCLLMILMSDVFDVSDV